MVTYAHKQLIGALAGIDKIPDTQPALNTWVRAAGHLDFLQTNATKDERIIYASGPYSFVHSVAIPAKTLAHEGIESLLAWSDNPFHGIASYVSGGSRDTMWIERGKYHCGAPALEAGVDLIFARTFEGWSGPDRNYYEVNQEYSHLNGIHWRPEHSAYCRFDDNGDLAELVSITPRRDRDDVALVTFAWPALEEYLGIAEYVLVRMFDFTLLRYDQFSDWGGGPENVIRRSDDFIYRQKIHGDAAYTRGVQIIRPRGAREISEEVSNRWRGGGRNRQYVTFIAQDWRNKVITEISTDPAATTNYFQAQGNELPFEVSPAYFKPHFAEVTEKRRRRACHTVHVVGRAGLKQRSAMQINRPHENTIIGEDCDVFIRIKVARHAEPAKVTALKQIQFFRGLGETQRGSW
jgi:hypothetical protein